MLDNQAYILGGRTDADWTYPDDFYRYNPETDTWTQLEDLPFSGRSNMAVCSCNGVAYCGGGFAGEQNDMASYKTDWWSFDGKQWTQLPDIPTKYTDGLISFTHDDKVYVGYGYAHQWTAELFAFDTNTNTWSGNLQPDYTNINLGLGYAFAQQDNRIFAGLGFDTYNVNSWSEYDPAANTWYKRANIPCRGGVFFAATATSGNICLAGGRAFGGSLTTGGIYDHVWSYDIQHDTWSLCGHLPQPTENMIAFTINNTAYFGLGENADGQRLNHLYRINP